MSIGIGIFLLVVGAILAFAVHASLGWISISAVGWILLAAGLVDLVITLAVWSRRRRSTRLTQRQVYRNGQPVAGTEQRQVVSDAPPAGAADPPPDVRA
ncbi:hypothetical protein Athai_48230 [Actinocatenispora thailandica]|uniref:DUF6458 domain-containing protein n=1 Tax=Actinocatenispora thailandica TaxID=227318 RepID=A0A7R7DT21_9ACTN|nr:DUF6458 family protein [Actinocatenispora thailandica]BCJ37320.1 hypothetical protein Athai_48230 [Actinocatenispora thailandica]